MGARFLINESFTYHRCMHEAWLSERTLQARARNRRCECFKTYLCSYDKTEARS